jgi:RimJ/RimL family protein N-acetyltransferase
MLADYLKTYRNLITLKDGARVLLRPLVAEDRQRLIDLFAAASPDDTKYLRDPITDAAHVGGWVDHLDYAHVVPVVAVLQERLVGDATLHFLKGPQRHMGELRIFLARDFRRRGLGTHMLRALVDLARKAGLHLLKAEVVADQIKVIKAFQSLGFQPQCTFEDTFMFPDGATSDLVTLFLRLLQREEEF